MEDDEDKEKSKLNKVDKKLNNNWKDLLHQSKLRIKIERIYCINGKPYSAAIDLE